MLTHIDVLFPSIARAYIPAQIEKKGDLYL